MKRKSKIKKKLFVKAVEMNGQRINVTYLFFPPQIEPLEFEVQFDFANIPQSLAKTFPPMMRALRDMGYKRLEILQKEA